MCAVALDMIHNSDGTGRGLSARCTALNSYGQFYTALHAPFRPDWSTSKFLNYLSSALHIQAFRFTVYNIYELRLGKIETYSDSSDRQPEIFATQKLADLTWRNWIIGDSHGLPVLYQIKNISESPRGIIKVLPPYNFPCELYVLPVIISAQ